MSDFRVVGEDGPGAAMPPRPTVPIRLRELLPLITHADLHGHAWLNDLSDDPVLVTADLAEVLARFREILSAKRA